MQTSPGKGVQGLPNAFQPAFSKGGAQQTCAPGCGTPLLSPCGATVAVEPTRHGCAIPWQSHGKRRR